VTAADGNAVRGWIRDGGDGGAATGVFVHGFRSGAGGEKSLALARHAAARGHGWARFDLRGHGRDQAAFADFTVGGGLGDTLAVLDRLAPRPTLLVGSSLGGWLAVLAALRRPRQVGALLLIAPAFNFLRELFGSLPAEELRAWRSRGWREFPDHFGSGTFALHYDVLGDAAGYDVFETPVTLPCPVLILHGELDDVVPPDNSRRFLAHARTRGGVLRIVAGGDHRLSGHLHLLTAAVDELWPVMATGRTDAFSADPVPGRTAG
jgi:pimeloyl-ACP methyl ester carboxylesterase